MGAVLGIFPPGVTLSLNTEPGDCWLHRLLDVYDPVGGDVCRASLCVLPWGFLSKN